MRKSKGPLLAKAADQIAWLQRNLIAGRFRPLVEDPFYHFPGGPEGLIITSDASTRWGWGDSKVAELLLRGRIAEAVALVRQQWGGASGGPSTQHSLKRLSEG